MGGGKEAAPAPQRKVDARGAPRKCQTRLAGRVPLGPPSRSDRGPAFYRPSCQTFSLLSSSKNVELQPFWWEVLAAPGRAPGWGWNGFRGCERAVRTSTGTWGLLAL